MLRVQRNAGLVFFVLIFVYFFFTNTHVQPLLTTSTTFLDHFTTSTTRPALIGSPIHLSTAPGIQTYPRAIRLQSGDLLVSFTLFKPLNTLSLSLSHDNGTTWIPHSTVITKTPDEATPVDNAVLLELPSGRILCAFRAHTKEPAALNAEEKPGGQNEGYLFFRLQLHSSDDGGKTWQYLSTPTEEPGPAHGNWEPLLRMSTKGELQFFYSREIGGGKDQDNLMRVSKDEGKTWSEPRTVSGEGLVTRDGMMGVQEVARGSGVLMAVFESVEEKGDNFEARFEIWSVLSRDEGLTWGERRMIYAGWWGDQEEPHRLKRNTGAPSIALVGETLVVSFMTDEVKLEGMWHKNAYIKIITSHDQGQTWGNNTIVVESPAAWAGLLALDDRNVLVMCEHAEKVEARHVAIN